MNSKKIRKMITMSPEVENKLKKMAKILHTNQSQLIEDLVDEAASSFLELYENAKEKGLYASSLKVISSKLNELADEFEFKGGNNE
jgi:oligoribonuclease NrnB/cAMP/cGMP phosphodiesterase (DHH superfamily)